MSLAHPARTSHRMAPAHTRDRLRGVAARTIVGGMRRTANRIASTVAITRLFVKYLK